MTDVMGTCDICGKPSRTLYTCWKCGRKVCPEHHDPETGLCIVCASQLKKGGPAPWTKK